VLSASVVEPVKEFVEPRAESVPSSASVGDELGEASGWKMSVSSAKRQKRCDDTRSNRGGQPAGFERVVQLAHAAVGFSLAGLGSSRTRLASMKAKARICGEFASVNVRAILRPANSGSALLFRSSHTARSARNRKRARSGNFVHRLRGEVFDVVKLALARRGLRKALVLDEQAAFHRRSMAPIAFDVSDVASNVASERGAAEDVEEVVQKSVSRRSPSGRRVFA